MSRLLATIVIAAFTMQAVDADPVFAESGERPNIIYIMADDLGYGDLGCYGQKRIKTPHIDRLAAEGLKFTDHYAGHTVCRPSRVVLLTGRHSGHTPISSNTQYAFKKGERSVTTLLKQAGYATGGIGKWALGGADSTGAPFKQGFDLWFGYLDQGMAHNYYPEYLWRNKHKVLLPGNVVKQKRVAEKRTTYAHDLMSDVALSFIRDNASRPFFLQAHYTIPHANNEGGRATGNGLEVPDFGPYGKEDWPDIEKGFAAMVSRLDRDVGRMIALLKELKIERRTVVLFTSDNGPHQEGGHKMEYFDSNGKLRGFKRDLYEGGIRVPMIVWWPETVRAGAVTDHPSAFWDFLPTACELAGIKPPEDIDGISYLPTLLGKKQAQHDHLYWQSGTAKVAVRKSRWKALRVGKTGSLELYDLSKDIGEKNNVATVHPEVTATMAKIIADIAAGKR